MDSFFKILTYRNVLGSADMNCIRFVFMRNQILREVRTQTELARFDLLIPTADLLHILHGKAH